MSFSQPLFFILLLFIPVLIYLHISYLRKRTPAMIINSATQNYSSSILAFAPTDILMILRLIAVTLVIIALAGPQLVSKSNVRSSASETDIVFALDISKSMLIEDIKPNRIEALRDVLGRFITMRVHDRMGIVLYAGESVNWCPLTRDHAMLLSRINTMTQSDLSDGTAIGSGLASAVNILKQSTIQSKVIILLTDGENNAGIIDPVLAAQMAKRFNIKIYAIGVGSTGTALMPLQGFDGKKYYQKIAVTLNENTLKKLAGITGGEYFKATDAKALQSIYASIGKLETKKDKWVATVNYSSCFIWFVEAALLILLIEALLKFTVLRTWPA